MQYASLDEEEELFEGAEDLDTEELSGEDSEEDLDVTEDDEDEDEGLGDGNIGRLSDDPLSK